MSRLIFIDDAFRVERTEHELAVGETLADELMSLWPEGLDGAWRIYRAEVADSNEIAAVDLPHVTVRRGELYVVVRTPGSDPAFWYQVAIAVLFTVAARILTPRPRTKQGEGETTESGNNQLAGQTNVLRPGARVPDILGQVRAYPDLLTRPIMTWQRRSEHLQQFFVLGVGDYLCANVKVGETPLASISGGTIAQYPPGSSPLINAVKDSPEVQGMSLMVEDVTTIPATSSSFNGPAKTLTTQAALPVAVGNLINIVGTLNAQNDVFQKIVAIAAGGPPYVYTLDRTVVTEANSNPTIQVFVLDQTLLNRGGYSGTTFAGLKCNVSAAPGGLKPVPNGYAIHIDVTPTTTPARGLVRNYTQKTHPPAGVIEAEFQVEGASGALIDFGSSGASTNWYFYAPSSATGGTPPPAGPIQPDWTDWYHAPLETPDQLWIDIGFPQGLVTYVSGARQSATVQWSIEIRRPGTTAPVYAIPGAKTDNTATPLRWTFQFDCDTIDSNIAVGTGYEVRIKRTTAVTPDTSTTQHIDETVWERFAAMKSTVDHVFTDVTILQLDMQNTRSALSVGESSFNCIATRKLPSWNGSAWTAPAATNKWADNFVQRCKSSDGANKTDAQIDLAGIYALQTQLDALDGGDLGRISITLDQMQDIDSELLTIADVVRATVYRTGRKLFVTRDQTNATTIALFNGRAKSPDGESVGVRMTGDADNDCVTLVWADAANGWRQREYIYPEGFTPTNPLRVPTACANWAQAYRRAVFEWNKLKYRRETMTCSVTEDGRICRPGDVINMTDDIANLAISAGEILFVSGLVLTLDRDVVFGTGTYSVVLRDVQGKTVDVVPCVAVAGTPNAIQLSRATTVEIKPRDLSRGTLFAFYNDAAATVRKWLVTSVEVNGPYVQLGGVNYATKVYTGDSAALPAPPLLGNLSAVLADEALP